MDKRFVVMAGIGWLALTGSAANAAVFAFTGAVESWVVPTTSSYLISAAGAKGGDYFAGVFSEGGLGATVSARFVLAAGTTLNLVVAGPGSTFGQALPGGGGGASWVFVTDAALPLLVAGGGGGVVSSANLNEDSTGIGGPGTGGLAGRQAGGGAGWNGDGGSDAGANGGKSRPSFAGGTTSLSNVSGGFGGGGAGSLLGGGGGGFTGGKGGTTSPLDINGNGGTSFVGAGGRDAVFGTGSRIGSISIAAVPEPASWGLMITGFGAIGTTLRAGRARLART